MLVPGLLSLCVFNISLDGFQCLKDPIQTSGQPVILLHLVLQVAIMLFLVVL